MTDSCTVLPAHKLLNLIGVRADENSITLSAKASASTARCLVCGKRSKRVHSRYTRTLANLPWQGVPVIVRLRVLMILLRSEGLQPGNLRRTFAWHRCTLRSQNRATRELVYVHLLRRRWRSGLAPSERPRCRGLRGHPVKPYPLATARAS
jgi:hypothetical protein